MPLSKWLLASLTLVAVLGTTSCVDDSTGWLVGIESSRERAYRLCAEVPFSPDEVDYYIAVGMDDMRLGISYNAEISDTLQICADFAPFYDPYGVTAWQRDCNDCIIAILDAVYFP